MISAIHPCAHKSGKTHGLGILAEVAKLGISPYTMKDMLQRPIVDHCRMLLIFDCDGTLVDSERLGHIAMARCLARAGVTESAGQLAQRYRGAKLATMIEDIAARHSWTAPRSFVSDYRQETEALFSAELTPIPDVKVALSSLSNPVCVASSGPMEKIRHSLELANLLECFDGHIYSSYVVGSWRPEPGLFLNAARAEGFHPSRCIVIEDSLVGAHAAEKAGMR